VVLYEILKYDIDMATQPLYPSRMMQIDLLKHSFTPKIKRKWRENEKRVVLKETGVKKLEFFSLMAKVL